MLRMFSFLMFLMKILHVEFVIRDFFSLFCLTIAICRNLLRNCLLTIFLDSNLHVKFVIFEQIVIFNLDRFRKEVSKCCGLDTGSGSVKDLLHSLYI